MTRRRRGGRVLGLADAKVRLRKPRRLELGEVEADALADTGSVHLCIPQHMNIQLRLEEKDTKEVVLADGSRKPMPYVGPVELRYENRIGFAGALVVGNEPLLAVIPTEDLNLSQNRKSWSLYSDAQVDIFNDWAWSNRGSGRPPSSSRIQTCGFPASGSSMRVTRCASGVAPDMDDSRRGEREPAQQRVEPKPVHSAAVAAATQHEPPSLQDFGANRWRLREFPVMPQWAKWLRSTEFRHSCCLRTGSCIRRRMAHRNSLSLAVNRWRWILRSAMYRPCRVRAP